MTWRLNMLLIFGVSWGFAVHLAHAQTPVPPGLPPGQTAQLKQRYTDIKTLKSKINKRIDALEANCKGVKVGSAEDNACAKEDASIADDEAEVKRIEEPYERDLKAAIAQRDAAALPARIAALDAQIAETQEQLRGLGFKRAEADFVWFTGQSEKAQQEMISQLISRFKDYAAGKVQSKLVDGFYDRIRAMKPGEIIKLADSLKRLGADDPLFQQFLRSLSPNTARAEAVDGLKLAIKTINDGKTLFEVTQWDKKTIREQQETALSLLEMVIGEVPAMDELKLVATGAYDVGEAWATIFILDRGINELTVSTETQLANQKKISARMKSLVDQRKEAREMLAKLQP